jgi:hypothetical protein
MFDQFKKIGNEIYVYENFLSKNECDSIVSLLDSLEENKWILDRPDMIMRRTDRLEEIIYVRNKMLEIVPDGLILGPASTATRLVSGDSWGEHSDVHDFAEIEKIAATYIEGNPYEEKDLSVYGSVVYFNKFEGGEIYYPTQGIIYASNPGDLVVHSSSPLCFHGVKPVISEKRYSYSNHMYKKVKVPL